MDPKHALLTSADDCKSQRCGEDSKLFIPVYLLMRKYEETEVTLRPQ